MGSLMRSNSNEQNDAKSLGLQGVSFGRFRALCVEWSNTQT